MCLWPQGQRAPGHLGRRGMWASSRETPSAGESRTRSRGPRQSDGLLPSQTQPCVCGGPFTSPPPATGRAAPAEAECPGGRPAMSLPRPVMTLAWLWVHGLSWSGTRARLTSQPQPDPRQGPLLRWVPWTPLPRTEREDGQRDHRGPRSTPQLHGPPPGAGGRRRAKGTVAPALVPTSVELPCLLRLCSARVPWPPSTWLTSSPPPSAASLPHLQGPQHHSRDHRPPATGNTRPRAGLPGHENGGTPSSGRPWGRGWCGQAAPPQGFPGDPERTGEGCCAYPGAEAVRQAEVRGEDSHCLLPRGAPILGLRV